MAGSRNRDCRPFATHQTLFMTTQNQHPDNTPSKEDETVDVRDLVSKPEYDKDPREVIENPAVTPQMLEESQDSQAGMDRSDRG